MQSAAYATLVLTASKCIGNSDAIRTHHPRPCATLCFLVHPRTVFRAPFVATQSQYAAEDYLYEERLDWAKLRKLMRIPSNLYNILQVRSGRQPCT